MSKRERLRQHHPIFKTSFFLSGRMSSDLFQRKLRRRSLDEKNRQVHFFENVLSEKDFFAKKEKNLLF